MLPMTIHCLSIGVVTFFAWLLTHLAYEYPWGHVYFIFEILSAAICCLNLLYAAGMLLEKELYDSHNILAWTTISYALLYIVAVLLAAILTITQLRKQLEFIDKTSYMLLLIAGFLGILAFLLMADQICIVKEIYNDDIGNNDE